jgi:hypothetical protein
LVDYIRKEVQGFQTVSRSSENNSGMYFLLLLAGARLRNRMSKDISKQIARDFIPELL